MCVASRPVSPLGMRDVTCSAVWWFTMPGRAVKRGTPSSSTMAGVSTGRSAVRMSPGFILSTSRTVSGISASTPRTVTPTRARLRLRPPPPPGRGGGGGGGRDDLRIRPDAVHADPEGPHVVPGLPEIHHGPHGHPVHEDLLHLRELADPHRQESAAPQEPVDHDEEHVGVDAEDGAALARLPLEHRE